jgi:diguanylate cyclase (GGDEF)-like protein
MQGGLTLFTGSAAFRALEAEANHTGCLVRIYPAEGIGEVFELDHRGVTIGREPVCDIVLRDDSVSRRHAMIECCPEGFLISDLGSTNGVYINDLRADRQSLTAGDRIRLGNQIFKYVSSDRIESQYHELVYKAMTTDGLTQAFNKRYLLEVLDRELSRCRRTGRPLSVLMIDLDRFKDVNDKFGHLAGDSVLVEFARRASSLLRRDEILARYGGEEFAVVLTDTPVGDARVAAERLRQAIADTPFLTERAEVSVAVSIGIAESRCTEDEDASALLDRADAMLYAAKQAGRNRCSG